jgi:hypothetical protein
VFCFNVVDLVNFLIRTVQVTLQCLGAAFAVAAPSVPAWNSGYAGGNIGGLLEAILQPTKGFGKFLTVLLSLSVAGNIAASLYSASLNIQVFIPPLVIVPRYVFSIVTTAMYDHPNYPIHYLLTYLFAVQPHPPFDCGGAQILRCSCEFSGPH